MTVFLIFKGERARGLLIVPMATDLFRASYLLDTELNIDSLYVRSFDGDFRTLDPTVN